MINPTIAPSSEDSITLDKVRVVFVDFCMFGEFFIALVYAVL